MGPDDLGILNFGVGLPNYGPKTSFDAICRVALAAEELGYDSVWTTDHVIVPKENIETCRLDTDER